ncbi:MAG: alpha/beta fold hydrolase [Myxococcales bacterium]|nr:alpha/beta fold hydrolase [Myxococcales bacterium]
MPLLGAELASPSFSARGMHVAAVRAGSMADEAGLAAGDVVVGIGGLPVRSARELRRAWQAIGQEPRVAIESERGLHEATVQRRPSETVPGATVEYGQIDRDVSLRTIVTRPAARAPAVLFLQGIGPSSLDFVGGAPPIARLLHGLAAEGLVTMRLERRGVGDSEGELPDFDTEVADAQAALAWLRARPFVQGVVLLGHSLGGMVAPLLEGAIARVVYGTTARPWFTTLEEGTRRQLLLRGASAAEIDAAWAEERRALDEDEIVHERSRAFHQQLAATDLASAWRRRAARMLVLAGEHDWVVDGEEQADVAALAGGEIRTLPGLDHAFTHHDSLAASLAAYGKGAWSSRIVQEIAGFVREVTGAGSVG